MSKTESIFNQNNQSWKTGKYPLVLGEPLGLYDSVNTPYPELFDHFKLLKSMDWSEDEVNLEQSRMDLLTCSVNNRDIMIKTLAFQWELDSVASRAIAPLFAPFVTNSELWVMLSRQSDNENLHCLTSDHDVLTTQGWKSIKDITVEDKVAQWDYDTNGISFVHPTATISKSYDGKMYFFENPTTDTYDQFVTGEHRMPVIYPYPQKGLKKFKFAQDGKVYNSTNGAPVAGFKNGYREMTPLEKLYIAVQADGSLCSDKYTGDRTNTKHYRFGFKKQRKITQFKNLMSEGGWRYTEFNCNEKTYFDVYVPKEDYLDNVKTFNWVDLESVSHSWCCEFLENVLLWDGCNRDNSKHQRYTSSVKENAEFVQTICHFVNRRASIYTIYATTREINGKLCDISEHYQVYFCKNGYISGSSIVQESQDYSGEVYCLSVPSEYFMVRRNGVISITGNSLTYSEIIRQCISDPTEVFEAVMENDEVLNRSTTVVEAFDKLAEMGAKYKLGMVSKDDLELKQTILKGFIALYCLEKIEFMSSFACTFALAEQNIFQGIAKLVQLIMRDEQQHASMDESIVKILLNQEEWQEVFESCKEDIELMIKQIIEQEFSWNSYLFSEGRSIVGLNETLLREWVLFNSQRVYDFLGLKSPFEIVRTNPLPWMMNWIDLNKTQNANQESDNTNYRLNSVVDDSEDEVFEI